MEIIRRDGLVARPWKNGGGVTREIAFSPPGSGLDDFDWRLSTAEVAADGPFSRFAGVDRRLYLLDGAGLDLCFTDRTSRLLTGEHLDFAGEAEVFGALLGGPVTDLNIMVRRDRARMRAGRMTLDGVQEVTHRWGTAALFVLKGEITAEGAVAGRFDTLLLGAGGSQTIAGAAELLLIGFEGLA